MRGTATRHGTVVLLLGVLGGLAGVSGATTTAGLAAPPPTVPATYEAAYAGVQSEVADFAGQVPRSPPRAKTTVGAELLTANGNIGEALLSPHALDGVTVELDAYQKLGITGVTVDVSYPLLLSTTPGHARYLTFYESVARAVRRRHMVLSVEENPVFVGTPLTSLDVSYAGLTLQSYAQGERREAQLIIDDVRPAYLSLLTEPDTFTDALGVNVDTPASSVELVRSELAGLRRGRTQVGAGTGTWSSPAIDRALLARTSIDYLDVHVYPLGPGPIAALRADTAAAQSARKPLVMDETWLDKPSSGEGHGPIGAPAELKVKSYSFWEPLDEAYLRAMTSYVRAEGYRYVSFFDGSRAFFGYLSWSPALAAASYEEFTHAYDHLVGANMLAGTVSGTGRVLTGLLEPPA